MGDDMVTLEMLNHAFDIAEQETADWFNSHTCSMENKEGRQECPICFFRRRVKHVLGLAVQPDSDHSVESADDEAGA